MEYRTPDNALRVLPGYIPKNYRIWEPRGDHNIIKYFEDRGYNIQGTNEKNFLDIDPPLKSSDFDCIVSKPDFSTLSNFLERCIYFKKPFMLLMPITALETERRQRYFQETKIKIILFDRRVQFLSPQLLNQTKKTRPPMATAWFCHGFENIPNVLNFSKLV
tara:strand:+ start:795 stop:1280 length:486 start_codon:yes stop_codon:yes gene_type:complete